MSTKTQLVDGEAMQLPAGQFVDEIHEKDLIVIHHTVGGSARSTFEYWKQDPARIGTAFIVERDGMIYQTFPEDRWAYHLGLKGADAAGGRHERRSIGIEIASEGALVEKDGGLFAFGGTRHVDRLKSFDLGFAWRGFRYFDAYDPPQLEAVFLLVADLLDRHPGIPRQTVRDHRSGPGAIDGIDRLSFRGVLGHADLRADKSDPHPGFPWAELARRCNLEVLP